MKRDRYQNRIELVQGTLDMLILQTLRWGAQHGYGIGQSIRAGSADVLQVETGSLYPALHRLERQGRGRTEGDAEGAHNARGGKSKPPRRAGGGGENGGGGGGGGGGKRAPGRAPFS